MDIEEEKILAKISRQELLAKKEDGYYNLTNELYYIKNKLLNIKGYRSNSNAFNQLLISIDMMQEQIERDYTRYKRRIRISDSSDEVRFLQKSLNRERLKREGLEKKIKEAKESSGLFINYVRDKFGL